MLKFSFGNAKIGRGIAIFNLPAGHSCPFAQACRASVDRTTGRLTDGPLTEFRCYAASSEALYPNVRAMHWHNFDLLKGKRLPELIDVIAKSLPEAIRYRIHSSGDFFSQAYFDAWLAVARLYPERIFYAYTKALPFWIARLGTIPDNVRLNASYGGTHDKLIELHKLKSCRVVYSQCEADNLKLKIDHDDTLAWNESNSFAVLLHGTQPPNSPASKAWSIIKKNEGGYNRKKGGQK